MRRRHLLLGCLVAVVVAAGTWLWFAAQPTGDPGGRVLDQLRPATAALPSDARIAYRNDVEPRWDSCDGRPGTEGWNDVVLQVHFTTATPDIDVLAHAEAALSRLGWLPDASQPAGYSWTKALANGTTAKASLEREVGPDAWTLWRTTAARADRRPSRPSTRGRGPRRRPVMAKVSAMLGGAASLRRTSAQC